ncbi:MAG: hypothetical protein Q9162_004221 [Coniocarpon cinnabarinum]
MQRILFKAAGQRNRASLARAGHASTQFRQTPVSFAASHRRLAHSDYGTGEPKPGPNPSEDQEHPGPPAPDTSSGSSSGNSGAKGKPLHFEQQDGTGNEEVRKHNEEMEKRQAKSHDPERHNDPKDKVEKGFWRGEGDQ